MTILANVKIVLLGESGTWMLMPSHYEAMTIKNGISDLMIVSLVANPLPILPYSSIIANWPSVL